jgi:hypothetical protein
VRGWKALEKQKRNKKGKKGQKRLRVFLPLLALLVPFLPRNPPHALGERDGNGETLPLPGPRLDSPHSGLYVVSGNQRVAIYGKLLHTKNC